VLIGGAALHPVATAKAIRIRDGERTVTDGPFAEAKEQFGGSYLLERKDLDEAMEWATRIPGARVGTVEPAAHGVRAPRRVGGCERGSGPQLTPALVDRLFRLESGRRS